MSMKKLVVKKSNELALSRYDLSLVQLRLLNLCNAVTYYKIEYGKEAKEVLDIDLYSRVYKVKPSTAQKQIRESIPILLESTFESKKRWKDDEDSENIEEIEDENKDTFTAKWFDDLSYAHNERIKFTYHQKTQAHMFSLRKNFISYDIRMVSSLSSLYSLRLYEILRTVGYEQRGRIIDLSLNELSYMLCCEDKYKDTEGFNRVIKRSIDEINQETDLNVNHKVHKLGKSINGYEFTVMKKVGFISPKFI